MYLQYLKHANNNYEGYTFMYDIQHISIDSLLDDSTIDFTCTSVTRIRNCLTI